MYKTLSIRVYLANSSIYIMYLSHSTNNDINGCYTFDIQKLYLMIQLILYLIIKGNQCDKL